MDPNIPTLTHFPLFPFSRNSSFRTIWNSRTCEMFRECLHLSIADEDVCKQMSPFQFLILWESIDVYSKFERVERTSGDRCPVEFCLSCHTWYQWMYQRVVQGKEHLFAVRWSGWSFRDFGQANRRETRGTRIWILVSDALMFFTRQFTRVPDVLEQLPYVHREGERLVQVGDKDVWVWHKYFVPVKQGVEFWELHINHMFPVSNICMHEHAFYSLLLQRQPFINDPWHFTEHIELFELFCL